MTIPEWTLVVVCGVVIAFGTPYAIVAAIVALGQAFVWVWVGWRAGR